MRARCRLAWLQWQAKGIPDGELDLLYFKMSELAYVGLLLEVERDNDLHVLRVLEERKPREA